MLTTFTTAQKEEAFYAQERASYVRGPNDHALALNKILYEGDSNAINPTDLLPESHDRPCGDGCTTHITAQQLSIF